MSDQDVKDSRRDLAQSLIVEVQSWEDSADGDGTERLASPASEPVVLACFHADITAEARDQGQGLTLT